VEQRYVGRSGLRVSWLGLGTMTWGRDTDVHEAADQLRDFAAAGGTLVQTASGFAGGVAEEVVGSLLGEVVDRSELVLAGTAGVGPGGTDCSRRALLASLDATLARLGTDHLDLWSVQRWDDHVPEQEWLSALEAAVTSGRARYAGVSNVRGWQLARAVTLAERGPAPVVASEQEYSLVQRSADAEVLPAAVALGVGVLAWAPLGRGVLTGKYRTGTPADSRGASPHFGSWVEPYLDRPARSLVDAVATAADGLGRAPLEVALAWGRRVTGVAGLVVGARTAAQLRGALAADDVELPGPIRAALDDASREAQGRRRSTS
jgi:aryl-alcohol dehydrogenase-like predicted oxidoreductase